MVALAYIMYSYGAGTFMYFEGIELRKKAQVKNWIPVTVFLLSPFMLPYFFYVAVKQAYK